VGTCGFPAPPRAARIELAYFTFPGAEGRGVATEMARRLVALARATQLQLTLFAHTLPRTRTSTTILARLGFALMGTIGHPGDGLIWEWHLAPAPAGLPRNESPL
jgi:[ribosomal protein S5]-alanine N-acetyltransferase